MRKSVIVISVVIVALVLAYYWIGSSRNSVTAAINEYNINIYTGDKLIKTINAREVTGSEDHTIKPSMALVSPDQKYAAFVSGGFGGTCVAVQGIYLIDLEKFETITVDLLEVREKLQNISRPNVNWAIQEVKNINWTTGNKLIANLQYGGNENFCYEDLGGESPIGANISIEISRDGKAIATLTN